MSRQSKTSLVEGFEQKTRSALGLGYAPQEEGTTIRNPSSSLFCVSSADRFQNINEKRNYSISPYRFTINKNESLLNGFVSRLALTEVRFNWNLPNVFSSAGTNKIQITSGNQTSVLTLPTGFYTPKTLGIYLNTTWNNTYPNNKLNLSYLSDQGYYVLQDVSGQNIAIAPDPGNTSNYKQLYDIMNWAPGSQTVNTTPKNSGIVNLRWTDYIDIVCTQLTYNQDLKDTTTQPSAQDMLCRIYLDESVPSDASYMTDFTVSQEWDIDPPPPIPTQNQYRNDQPGYGGKNNGCRPCVIYRQFVTPKYIKWSRIAPIGQVQFEVYDDQGRCLADFVPLNLLVTQNDWNITMLASEQ